MGKTRIEAFSDGVIAIILTILVLELRVPHGFEVQDLKPLLSKFACYLMSFGLVGIYWNNHHHLFQMVRQISGKTLLVNLHLLFWLSLVPFFTAWLGESHFAPWPVALYGANLFFCGFAYYLLTHQLMAHHGKDSQLSTALGRDKKGIMSVGCYLLAIPIAFVSPGVSCAIYAFVEILWLIPDSRIERRVKPS